jgi:hypothetical protein
LTSKCGRPLKLLAVFILKLPRTQAGLSWVLHALTQFIGKNRFCPQTFSPHTDPGRSSSTQTGGLNLQTLIVRWCVIYNTVILFAL